MHRKLYLLTFAVLFTITANSQQWYEQMRRGENYFQVRKSFDSYKDTVNIWRQGPIKPFERWAHRMMERSYPNGDLSGAPNIYTEYKAAMSGKSSHVKSTNYPSWNSLGPNIVPSSQGNGRLNFIEFHPDSLDVIFVGAPVGGLWKSRDGGINFQIMNDTLPVIGCSDLAIDYTNPDIMYLATGDRDASDSYSIGILKSSDGGYTWDTTGLNWQVQDQRTIGRVEMNPFNHNMLIAATSNGIYKTDDAGLTWRRTFGGDFQDVQFKPGDSSTIYVAGDEVRVSTDAGESFTGTNISGFINRIEIAVTEDDPNYVYAISSYAGNSGLDAIWRSTNSGQSFTKVFNNGGAGNGNNLLGWSANGTGTGGQGWFDLAIAVSPLDKNNVVIGGVNTWQSLDGGANWSPISHWTGTGATYIHADQHDIIFKPGTDDIYAANDGGIYYTTTNGAIWIDLTATLQVTQSYRLGISQSSYGLILAGNQDNGTFKREVSGNFLQVSGGDGFECIVDYTNDLIIYSSIYYGNISRADNGASFIQIAGQGVNGISESGAWETPYVMDPFQNDVLYAGFNNVWRTDNSGASWQKRNNGSLPSNGKINQLQIAPWDIDKLMVSKGGSIYLSNNAGATFTNVTNGLPNLFITNIQFSPFFTPGTFRAYVTMSGYNAGNKLYRTTDGGQTWQNISAGLPNVPANCIVIDENTNPADEHLYVGTDIGVFYKNSSMTEFEPYSIGLPNTVVEEMEIQLNTGKIIACTYGRGLWEVPLMSTVVGFEDEEIVQTENLNLSIYPNPFENNLHIAYELKSEGSVLVEIYDLQGSVIFNHFEESKPTGLYQLDVNAELAELKEGMYLVKFRSGDDEITRKIVKQ